MKLWELDNMISVACPIKGIDTNGNINYAPNATNAQKQAAQAIMAQFKSSVEPA